MYAIHVSRHDTVVLGMGFATLRPVRGTPAMTTADADGIIIAGLLFDAGPMQSPVLLEVDRTKAKRATPKIPSRCTMSSFASAALGWKPHVDQFEDQQQ